ncbi:hypothetical protein Pyn_30411 [Prunus yedoensis var. nudiflora]|uniref:Uncharacterized protein n=1 Tax=Prunus yedoensis var. nudiflora TaxID=2094558 RepID=A0A314YRG8_PRUYE|nr:hypothetical protein Pyn_30411 [Prunus yedoensis var. nudiflora]
MNLNKRTQVITEGKQMVHGGSVKGKCKHHHNIGLVTGMHEPEQRSIGDGPDLRPRGKVVGKGGGCWVLVLGGGGKGRCS